MIQIKDEEHFNKVLSRNNGSVVVLFTAPAWCQPCRRFEPHWAKADNSELLDDFLLCTVDMGETVADTADHWATKRFNILGVPKILHFYNADMDFKVIQPTTVVKLIKGLTDG